MGEHLTLQRYYVELDWPSAKRQISPLPAKGKWPGKWDRNVTYNSSRLEARLRQAGAYVIALGREMVQVNVWEANGELAYTEFLQKQRNGRQLSKGLMPPEGGYISLDSMLRTRMS